MGNCKNCNGTVSVLKQGFCSNICKNFYKDKENEVLLTGIENEDYVVCLWNGYKCRNINFSYIKGRYPNKTIEDYKKDFPGARLQCESMIRAATKNAGKHMKTDKYKKMFSDKMKGENNPNHKSKTTEEERKSRSPFSKEFYLKDNPNLTDDELNEIISKFAKEAIKDRLTPSNVEYWLNKGYDENTAMELVKERQTTFTLDKCIAKHGEIKGVEVFELRQKNWSEKIEKMYSGGCFSKAPKTLNTSRISITQKKFCEDLINKTNLNITTEFELVELPKRYYYDFVNGNKIIEFNGDFWHCNPQTYTSDYQHPIIKKTTQEIWDYDKEKILVANSYGYEVLVIWESEYNNDKEKTLEKCYNFLVK